MPNRAGIRNKLLREQGGYCLGCGETKEEILARGSKTTFDHILPRVLGGIRTKDNLVVVCDECNSRKGEQWPWDWYGEQYLIWKEER